MSDVFRFACRIVKETTQAILVVDYATEEELWFPLSTVEEIHRYPDGTGELVVQDWIAKKKGLL